MFVTASRCFKLCLKGSDFFDLVASHLVIVSNMYNCCIATTVYKLLHSNIAFP